MPMSQGIRRWQNKGFRWFRETLFRVIVKVSAWRKTEFVLLAGCKLTKKYLTSTQFQPGPGIKNVTPSCVGPDEDMRQIIKYS